MAVVMFVSVRTSALLAKLAKGVPREKHSLRNEKQLHEMYSSSYFFTAELRLNFRSEMRTGSSTILV